MLVIDVSFFLYAGFILKGVLLFKNYFSALL
uniref:Uncharacterized protein n=1 Tax=Arundo donax TaxID=35708 RepID=A0A0A9APP7_ARUDO